MENNQIIRRLRYAFDIRDQEMIRLFKLGNTEVSMGEVVSWLKKDIEPEWKALPDFQLAAFLNGFITKKRGKKDGPIPIPEKQLNNNIILRKLKIALSLKDDEMLEILSKSDLKISKHELSAFFRKPGQNQYRECKDQVLRNFLRGLQIKYRDGK